MANIDSHHHFWWMARSAHRWPEGVGDRLSRDFTPDDLVPELESAGVDGTVLVQVGQDPADTKDCLDVMEQNQFVRGVVGWVPLMDPPACARALDDLTRGNGKLVGIRHLISYEPDPDWLRQPPVIESLSLLAERNLTFDAIPVNQAQFEAVLDVAGQLPNLKFVINHLGRPPIPEQGWEPWATQIARAAELRNMSIKLSAGLDILLRWQWSTDDMRPFTDHVLDLFSPNRVMAASNWPVILLGGSYTQVWSGITELVSGLAEDEQRAVLGGTAERVYGL